MKNEYENLIIEVEELEDNDIITNSGESEEEDWKDFWAGSGK